MVASIGEAQAIADANVMHITPQRPHAAFIPTARGLSPSRRSLAFWPAAVAMADPTNNGVRNEQFGCAACSPRWRCLACIGNGTAG